MAQGPFPATESRWLTIDPASGMAGDMFAAALVGLGVPADAVAALMESAAEPIGGAEVTIRCERLPDGSPAHRIESRLRTLRPPLVLDEAVEHVERSIRRAGVTGPYASFALSALRILGHAERHAHEDLAEHGHEARDSDGVMLHEAQDIVMEVTAAAWGLQWLHVALDEVTCMQPVFVGRGTVRFSHGEFPVPAPATARILGHHAIPWAEGPHAFEQLTPTGAAILAALRPRYVERHPLRAGKRRGAGCGVRTTDPPNVLILTLAQGPPEPPPPRGVFP